MIIRTFKECLQKGEFSSKMAGSRPEALPETNSQQAQKNWVM